jgi:hypothetical protein
VVATALNPLDDVLVYFFNEVTSSSTSQYVSEESEALKSHLRSQRAFDELLSKSDYSE